MSQRLTRKEIKHDEFTEVMGRSVEYAGTHSRGLLFAAVGAVALVALGVGIYFYLGHRAGLASEALGEAAKVYKAPVTPVGAKPDDPKEPTFADEASRRARAKKLFEEVRDHYGFSDAADVAAVYLAQIATEEGDLARARQLWTAFVDHHQDHMLAQECRLNLFRLDRQQGKGEELIGRLRPMLDDPDSSLPQDVVLFELGQTYEQLSRKPEAVASYRRILDEFPQSAYRQSAQEQVAALDPSQAGGGMPNLGGTVGL